MKSFWNYIISGVRKFSTRHVAYICTIIGLIISIVFICVIWSQYSIGGDLDADDMAQTGQVGDFIGGIVGSIWALAGVFLYFPLFDYKQKNYLVKLRLKMKIAIRNKSNN